MGDLIQFVAIFILMVWTMPVVVFGFFGAANVYVALFLARDVFHRDGKSAYTYPFLLLNTPILLWWLLYLIDPILCLSLIRSLIG